MGESGLQLLESGGGISDEFAGGRRGKMGGERLGRLDLVAEQLPEKALAWARSLAEGGPQALARTKDLLRSFSHQAMPLEETAKASAAPRLTTECRQGLEAFFAKQPAPWAAGLT